MNLYLSIKIYIYSFLYQSLLFCLEFMARCQGRGNKQGKPQILKTDQCPLAEQVSACLFVARKAVRAVACAVAR